MFEICLFDLDDTLVRTTDLKEVREACKENEDQINVAAVKSALGKSHERVIFELDLLESIRNKFPDMRLGIFTRSPRSYVKEVLAWAYPNFKWDIIVAYEDVTNTKPSGEGIELAVQKLKPTSVEKIILVGDSNADVRSAYHRGCVVAFYSPAGQFKRSNDTWDALRKIPDAVIEKPADLMEVLKDPIPFLPELERIMADGQKSDKKLRFEKINHLIPREIEQGSDQIYVCGRFFANYTSLTIRRGWHSLTHSIEDHKDAEYFPEEWVVAVYRFIRDRLLQPFAIGMKVVVTTVPHRPGRFDRLACFLKQLDDYISENPIKFLSVEVKPGLLKYNNGVRSNHREFLNKIERFKNVRDHLEIADEVKQKVTYLVLDDVVTTGASLIYARKYLIQAGASAVISLAIAKNISDVLKYD